MARLLLLGGLVLAFVVPVVSAQVASTDEVILQFDISKNGSLVARPMVRMRVGYQASFDVKNGPTKLSIDTVRHDGVIEAICEFQFADGTKPTLRIKLGQEPASAKVPVGKDTFEIKVAMSQPK
jgi:hypothetical protein